MGKKKKNGQDSSFTVDEQSSTEFSLNPWNVLREAIKAVPMLKYVLGIIGIVSAIPIFKGFGVDFRMAVVGTIVMLVLMVALVVFAALSKVKNAQIKLAALVLMWSFLALTIASAFFLFLSVFFDIPKPWNELLGSAAPVQEVDGSKDNEHSGEKLVNKISIKIRTETDIKTFELDGPDATLGDVLLKAKTESDHNKIVAINRNSKVIYLPLYFATSTDAAKIAIEDNDEIACLTHDHSPLASDRLQGFRMKLKAAFSNLFPANVTPSIEMLQISMEAWNEALEDMDFTDLSKDQLESEIAKANKLISEYRNELLQEGLIGRYSVSGIVQNPGERQLEDVTTIDEILTDEKAIANNEIANIIVLQRGDTISVLPFRDALRTGTVPATVMSAYTKIWTQAAVLNNDSYEFTRLALFAPVAAELEKK